MSFKLLPAFQKDVIRRTLCKYGILVAHATSYYEFLRKIESRKVARSRIDLKKIIEEYSMRREP